MVSTSESVQFSALTLFILNFSLLTASDVPVVHACTDFLAAAIAEDVSLECHTLVSPETETSTVARFSPDPSSMSSGSDESDEYTVEDYADAGIRLLFGFDGVERDLTLAKAYFEQAANMDAASDTEISQKKFAKWFSINMPCREKDVLKWAYSIAEEGNIELSFYVGLLSLQKATQPDRKDKYFTMAVRFLTFVSDNDHDHDWLSARIAVCRLQGNDKVLVDGYALTDWKMMPKIVGFSTLTVEFARLMDKEFAPACMYVPHTF